MGVTGQSTPKKLQCCCICAFALFVALLLISCPVSADSQADNDLVFENFDIPNNQHISRRHVPNKSSIHQDVESSQDLEDNRYFHRIKRNLIGLFDFFGTSTEEPNEIPVHQKAEDDADWDAEGTKIGDIDVGGKAAERRLTRQSLIDDDDDIHGSGEGSGVDPDLHSGVYRFSITVHEPYIEEYANRNSEEFKKLESDLVDAVEQIYEDMPGTQTASIVEIEEIPDEHIQCKVTMDLTSADYKNKNAIKDRLLNKIEDHHRLGHITVDPKDFIFSEFEDRVRACGPEEFPCANGEECVPIEFKCDNIAQCLDSSDEAGCPATPITPIETTPPTTTSTSTTTTTTTTTPAPPPIPATTEAPSPVEPAVRPEVVLPEIVAPVETEAPTTPTTTSTSTTTQAVVVTPEQIPNVVLPEVHNQVTARTLGQCRADDTFTCTDGQLICADQQCDGIRDCVDASDEEGCFTPPACAIGEFSCDLNRCIQATQRCDGVEDCDDKTDELDCPAKCHPYQFTCDDGSCIERNQQCNGKLDCPRGEDEAACQPERCKSQEFTCGDGRCIPMAAKCDGKYDCTDYSDEKFCPCKEDDFRCKNGYCIPKTQRCDGTRNCQDESDEINCTSMHFFYVIFNIIRLYTNFRCRSNI